MNKKDVLARISNGCNDFESLKGGKIVLLKLCKDGITIMNLMEQWRSVAYNEATGKEKLQQLWAAYFQEEKEIYAQLLKNPDEVVKGTVKELADKFKVSLMTMTGFLDGINDSLVEKNPIDDLEEDTQVNLGFDKAPVQEYGSSRG